MHLFVCLFICLVGSPDQMKRSVTRKCTWSRRSNGNALRAAAVLAPVLALRTPRRLSVSSSTPPLLLRAPKLVSVPFPPYLHILLKSRLSQPPTQATFTESVGSEQDFFQRCSPVSSFSEATFSFQISVYAERWLLQPSPLLTFALFCPKI